jgi:hypothetical protein
VDFESLAKHRLAAAVAGDQAQHGPASATAQTQAQTQRGGALPPRKMSKGFPSMMDMDDDEETMSAPAAVVAAEEEDEEDEEDEEGAGAEAEATAAFLDGHGLGLRLGRVRRPHKSEEEELAARLLDVMQGQVVTRMGS